MGQWLRILNRHDSFRYNHKDHLLTMSSPSDVHEVVSNYLGTYVRECGEPFVIAVGEFVGSLDTATKKMFVGPNPDPNDPSRHVQKLTAPALLVPDGSVMLRFPGFTADGLLVPN